jgi:hypothetical protein
MANGLMIANGIARGKICYMNKKSDSKNEI